MWDEESSEVTKALIFHLAYFIASALEAIKSITRQINQIVFIGLLRNIHYTQQHALNQMLGDGSFNLETRAEKITATKLNLHELYIFLYKTEFLSSVNWNCLVMNQKQLLQRGILVKPSYLTDLKLLGKFYSNIKPCSDFEWTLFWNGICDTAKVGNDLQICFQLLWWLYCFIFDCLPFS